MRTPILPPRRGRAVIAVAALALALAPWSAALAHPHVWIDYAVTVRFGPDGPDGVRIHWVFDEMMSAVIAQTYDRDRDGAFSPAETKAIERDVIAHLKTFNFFTEVRVDHVDRPVTEIREFEARQVRGQLHYLFTVPIAGAPRHDGAVHVNVDDPTFFTAFTQMARAITFEGGTHYRVDCAALRDPKTNRPEGLRCTYRRTSR